MESNFQLSNQAVQVKGCSCRFAPVIRHVLGLLALFHACALSAYQITLEWDDNSNNETGFIIERAVDLGDFQEIGTVGADVGVYVDSTAEPGKEYRYQVRAYNAAGRSEPSNVVSNAPIITAQPTAPPALSAGHDNADDATLSVEVGGSPRPTIQWQCLSEQGWTNLVNGGHYSGVTTGTLLITNAAAALNGLVYRVLATSVVGSVISTSVQLEVTAAAPVFVGPEIVEQPSSSVVVNVGGSASFSVTAAPSRILGYRWRKDGVPLKDDGRTSGSRTATLRLSSISTADAGTYTVVVANGTQPDAISRGCELTVVKFSQAISFPWLTPRNLSDGLIELAATSSVGLPISYSSSDPDVAFVSGNTLLMRGVGTATIVARQTGNGRYLAASDASQELVIGESPRIIVQPVDVEATLGASAIVSVTGDGLPVPAYQWQKDGIDVPGATEPTLRIDNYQIADAGVYSVLLANAVGSVRSRSVVVGLVTSRKTTGAAVEVGPNIVHPNGNVFDQVVLEGSGAAITADPGQITRVSFIDLSDDIVQVEFSGAGTLSIMLTAASGPAFPEKYNQNVRYMKGHASLVVAGANQTTNLSVFSVGRTTAMNQALFRNDVVYDGMADIALVSIESFTGSFGALRTSNASYFAMEGYTGIHAPGVQFVGPVYAGDIAAFDTATPILLLGSAADVRITGGNLEQENGAALQLVGVPQLRFTDGVTSHGRVLPAQANAARLELYGVDITDEVVINPDS